MLSTNAFATGLAPSLNLWLTGYEIVPDVKHLLDQLKAQAEALGLPRDGKDPSHEPSQAGEDKAPKKLPPQLNPLLAKLARAAARENDQHGGQICQ